MTRRIDAKKARNGMLAAAALLLLAAAPADARGRNRGNGDGPGCGDRMADRLELTEEQREKVDAIREEGREEMVGVRKEMMRLRHEMRGVWLEDDPDGNAAKKLVERIGTLRTKMEAMRLDHRLAIREVLTPEQRDKMLLAGPRGFDRPGKGRGPGAGIRPHRDCAPEDCPGHGPGGGGRRAGGRGPRGLGGDGPGAGRVDDEL